MAACNCIQKAENKWGMRAHFPHASIATAVQQGRMLLLPGCSLQPPKGMGSIARAGWLSRGRDPLPKSLPMHQPY